MSLPKYENPFASDRIGGPADYRLEWDVPSMGRRITDALSREITRVREHPEPEGSRKLHFLTGLPGHGKTHLFERLRHEQGDKIQFVFVAAPSDEQRVLDHIRWHVVETLVESDGKVAPALPLILAQIIRRSFGSYLDQLPPGLHAITTSVRHALASNAAAVLQITNKVNQLPPFQALAFSFIKRFPSLDGTVLRAFVLGLSPAAHEARMWLRGEAEQISTEEVAHLRLGTESPTPRKVLHVLATLLQLIEVPLVLCLDQLDVLYLRSGEQFQYLVAELMGWLQTIPNLIVVVGCVDETWRQMDRVERLKAFQDRVLEHRLGTLQRAEVRELIVRRMASQEGFDRTKAPGWPFALDSAEQLADKEVSPRKLIRLCSAKFTEWLAHRKPELIQLTAEPPLPATQDQLFLQEWSQRLAKVRQSLKAATNYQDAELWEGAEEALMIAKLGNYAPSDLKIEKYQLQALRKSPTDPRYSAQIDLMTGGKRASVVLAVNKKDGDQAFRHWVTALENALGGNVAGAVVVWPKAELSVGKKAQAYLKYKQLELDGTVRPFPLDQEEDTFAQIECLRQVIRDDAFIIGGQALDVDSRRNLVVKTGILANLKLFEVLFHNWAALPVTVAPPVPPPATRPEAPPPPVPQPTATQPKPITASTTIAVAPPPQPAPDESGWATQMLATVAEKLRLRGQPIKPLGVEVGPTFVRLKVAPRDDTDFAKVKKQADNLKLQLGLTHRPIIAAEAGYISINIQRQNRQIVPLASVLPGHPATLNQQPAFPVGKGISGETLWLNLAEPATCHLLIAGTTGSGKSQLLKALIAALADHLPADQVQFILIDPKRVTFSLHGSSPYLRNPVVYDAEAALPLLEECCDEMERRYEKLAHLGKEHIGELTGRDGVPRWVVVFDEFADLMSDRSLKKDMESYLTRLGSKARAAGIHLVLGTQRPEASVVTPLLRTNLPGRIALQVPTERDSKLLLDQPDAAYLLDKGDLFYRRGGSLIRLQSPFVTNDQLRQYLRVH